MVASAHSVAFIGAVPIFLDVDAETLTITPEIVKPHLVASESHAKPKAVIHVSLNNRCNKLDELAALCTLHGVLLIEDAAQSLGSWYKNRHTGTYGNVATFSFSTPKIISTGQGGCIVTDDSDLAERISKVKGFGKNRHGTPVTCGINMKFSDLSATVGLEQVKKLPGRVEKLRKMWGAYSEKLASCPYLKMLEPNDSGWIPWFIEVFVVSEQLRDGLAAWLRSIGIGSRKVYPPIHRQPAYGGNSNGGRSESCPVASKAFQTGLWLPSYCDLEFSVVSDICDCVLLYFRLFSAVAGSVRAENSFGTIEDRQEARAARRRMLAEGRDAGDVGAAGKNSRGIAPEDEGVEAGLDLQQLGWEHDWDSEEEAIA